MHHLGRPDARLHRTHSIYRRLIYRDVYSHPQLRPRSTLFSCYCHKSRRACAVSIATNDELNEEIDLSYSGTRHRRTSPPAITDLESGARRRYMSIDARSIAGNAVMNRANNKCRRQARENNSVDARAAVDEGKRNKIYARVTSFENSGRLSR